MDEQRKHWDELTPKQQQRVKDNFVLGNPHDYVYEIGLDGQVISRRRKRQDQAGRG